VNRTITAGLEFARRVAGAGEKRLRRAGDRARLGNDPIRIGDQLRASYETAWVDARCVFVCSTGRVGSQSLAALLGLSPEIFAVHEPLPRLVHLSFEAYLARGEGDWLRSAVLGARDDLICDANRRGLVYAETNNRLTFLAPALADTLPASRFIHLHRHPYEFVRSAMRRKYYLGHHWDFARPRPRPDEASAAEWDAYEAVAKCAWLWARVNDDAMRFSAALPSERVLTMAAAELFRGEPASMRKIFDLAGVESPPDTAVRRVLGRARNRQESGTFPDASEWGAPTRRVVDDIVVTVAHALGYAV
jgi:hypothetical protein